MRASGASELENFDNYIHYQCNFSAIANNYKQ